ncbi:sialate O-acetylesterase [Ereboglobus sp. PH5-5]|uniref:sialate O-acetylesterase n=1 Tax=Ereboglobus sp. PH5-5 TaxID=2940529 RepID=UPI002406CAAD|nr:sialate O-acetylesterase [Ereboglobus sp. PH5-5]MDF9832017.1 sialate O-acetylesterase [Ereboglobus sp. PH5-5]
MIRSTTQKPTHSRNRLVALAALIALSLTTATADVVFAPYFRDNAVLQRDKDVPVWGRADPGEKVTVTFQSQTVSATADDMGRWSVKLAPMPANATPASLVAKGKNTVTVGNVLVGEVWLCSGQSNMAWVVKPMNNAANEIAAANYPLIRHFKTKLVPSSTPADDAVGEWTVCSPETAGEFSATAFFFGRELFKKLNVPIGLLNSSWGGTQIEPWMSLQGLASDPAARAVFERWQDEVKSYPYRAEKYEKDSDQWKKNRDTAKKEGKNFTTAAPKKPEGPTSRRAPCSLYNGMIAPFVPAAIRGVIWYQGEANASRYAEYRTLFPTMIRQWRADFQQGDIPFYYVQLANYARGNNWAFLREAQEYALKLPNTGQAVTIDIGASNDIHPRNKQDVGLRLALNAFAHTYKLGGEYSGPMFAGVSKENGALRVKFDHAAGLKSKDPNLPGFVIAGADKRFFPAQARIEGETIVVSSERVKDPVAVRYAWDNDPPAPLYNGADLPASPFRSDDWK